MSSVSSKSSSSSSSSSSASSASSTSPLAVKPAKASRSSSTSSSSSASSRSSSSSYQSSYQPSTPTSSSSSGSLRVRTRKQQLTKLKRFSVRHKQETGSPDHPFCLTDSDESISGISDLSGRSTPPTRRSACPPEARQQVVSLKCPTLRGSPHPSVVFSDSESVWKSMRKSNEKYAKNPHVFKNNPNLSSQMRSILLHWIMDVCEAYNMHRESFYLAVDYLDRYLSIETSVKKGDLQLLGITCLFIAGKMEEIYPPKIHVFAFVTDGACSEAGILDMEQVVMTTLEWNLNPVTPANWVNMYLQAASILPYVTRSADRARSRQQTYIPKDVDMIERSYCGMDYFRTCRLLDLVTLSENSLAYSNEHLAAAALYHQKGRATALLASGLEFEEIASCAYWMAPYAAVMKKFDIGSSLQSIDGVSVEARHLIQSHCVTLEMLDKAEEFQTSKICSPITNADSLLTPPRSAEKNTRKRKFRPK